MRLRNLIQFGQPVAARVRSGSSECPGRAGGKAADRRSSVGAFHSRRPPECVEGRRGRKTEPDLGPPRQWPAAAPRAITFSLAAAILGLALTGAVRAEAEEGIPMADYDVEDLTFPDLREFEVPTPRRVELENGLTIFLWRDAELPQVKASARIATGSVYDPADQVGLASIVGRVMRTGGTESMGPDAVNETLEGLGATVETSVGQTSATVFMSTLREGLDEVLPIFAEVLTQPAFAREKIALAKSRAKSAIARRNDQPRQIANREFQKLLYGEESPYARTEEYYTIDAIERSDAVGFHRRFVEPSSTLLSVWGDFEMDTMIERLKEEFGDWAPAEDSKTPSPPPVEFNEGYSVNLVVKEDVNQSTIFIGHSGSLTRDHPDYIPVSVMNEVLSGGFSGRLFRNVRAEQGLAYSVFGRYTAPYDRPGIFYAGIATKSGSTVEATRAVLDEIRSMREAPPETDELKLARDAYLNSFVFKFDTVREVLDRLMTYEHYGYPEDFLQSFREGVEQVTPEEVHRVSREYLRPDDVQILVVGRPQDFQQDLSTLGEVNRIDISIPTEPPASERAGEESPGESEEARRILNRMREALGGEALANLKAMAIEGRQTLLTPRGDMKLETGSWIELPDRLRAEQQTPQGEVTIVIDGEAGRIRTPQGTRKLPAEGRRDFLAQLWRNPIFLAARSDTQGLAVNGPGTEEIDGRAYTTVKVTPPVGSPFTLLVDQDSALPARIRYTAPNREGVPVEQERIFEDFREVDGIRVPHRIVGTQEGEKRQIVTRESVTINPAIESGTFDVER